MSVDDREHDVMLLASARTPTGSFSSAFLSKSAADLGAIAVKAALSRSGVDPATVYEVIMGNVGQAGAGQAPGPAGGLWCRSPQYRWRDGR